MNEDVVGKVFDSLRSIGERLARLEEGQKNIFEDLNRRVTKVEDRPRQSLGMIATIIAIVSATLSGLAAWFTKISS